MCMARREQGQFLIVYRITGSKPEDDNDERFAQSHSTRKPTDTTAEGSGTYSPAPLPGGLYVGWRPGPGLGPQRAQPQVERQAITNLLALYQEALVAEDSDSLLALLT